MKTNRLISLALLAFLALASATASALGEVSYTIEKQFASTTPIFMAGHAGDVEWVEGFTFSGTIRWNGALIGTVNGEVRAWNPPMNLLELTNTYDHVSMRIDNTITGLGTFQVFAHGVALNSSTTTSSGDLLISWTGSVANGTGYFDDFYGLSAGSGSVNLFAATAATTEIVTLRSGF